MPAPSLETLLLRDLTIDDKPSFRHVGVYADLEEILRRAAYTFRVLPETSAIRADRALVLNLTYWNAELGGDVLPEARIDADVVAHTAWHYLAATRLPKRGDRISADASLLGESIASAFDVYLVGRLLGHAPSSSFLATQVPAMAEAAEAAGLDDAGFEALLERIAEDPDAAFVSLRALLFDAARALFDANGADDALRVLASFDEHPFASLLHHYELSSWVLHARAYADAAVDDAARDVDRALRRDDAVDWLERTWVRPTLEATPSH